MVTAIQESNRRVLASVDDAARKLKLACGMTVAHAQSLVPDLVVEDAKPEEDEAALSRLALWCTRFSPLVTPYPPDTIFIDVAGSSHLFKGEAALLNDMRMRLASAQLSARAALADTPGCAWAVALWQDVIVSRARLGSDRQPAGRRAAASRRCHHLCTTWVSSGSRNSPASRAPEPPVRQQRAAASRSGARVDSRNLPSLIPPEVPRMERVFAEPVGDPEDLKRIIDTLREAVPRPGSARHRCAASRSGVSSRRQYQSGGARRSFAPVSRAQASLQAPCRASGGDRSRLRHRGGVSHRLVG